jgi:hypothetical protein
MLESTSPQNDSLLSAPQQLQWLEEITDRLDNP